MHCAMHYACPNPNAHQPVVGRVQRREERHNVHDVDDHKRGEAPPREGAARLDPLRDGVADTGEHRRRGHLRAHRRHLERRLVPLQLVLEAHAPPACRWTWPLLRYEVAGASVGTVRRVPEDRYVVGSQSEGRCQHAEPDGPAAQPASPHRGISVSEQRTGRIPPRERERSKNEYSVKTCQNGELPTS